MNRTIRASLLSASARAWLENTASACVMNMFSRSCNLINQEGEILSIVTPEIGPGPFSVVLDVKSEPMDESFFSEGVAVGSEVNVEAHKLYYGLWSVDTSDADVWDARPRWVDIYNHRNLVLNSVPQLMHHLTSYAPSASLAQYIFSGLSVDNGENEAPDLPSSISEQWMLAGMKHAHVLVKSIVDGRHASCEGAIRVLGGLGGGLTPSGDDFIMGVLYALRVVMREDEAARLAFRIYKVASPLTHHLSATYLKAAAQGEAAQVWHSLLDAMVGADEILLEAIVSQFMGIGHTSGADALAGFMSILYRYGRSRFPA